MAAAAVGTETDGSVTCPAAMNGLVGLKPTVGLISRAGVAPLSPVQDTPGPITRTVTDAALLLAAMAGSDPADPATREADAHSANYPALLDKGSLQGARLGVLRKTQGRSPQADAVFAAALERLKTAGAVLVEVKSPDETALGAAESLALKAEFKAAIGAYLAATPPAVQTRTLAALIAFDRAEPRELALFGQDTFEEALTAPDLTDPAYLAARDTARRLAGPEGVDRLLAENNVIALVALSSGPASVVDPVDGSVWLGSPSTLPAVAGYPHLTVPAGQVEGLPVGLSLIGPAWSEARLLSLGYAFEQLTGPLPPPSFQPSVMSRPDIAPALDPQR
jgi:amidase